MSKNSDRIRAAKFRTIISARHVNVNAFRFGVIMAISFESACVGVVTVSRGGSFFSCALSFCSIWTSLTAS